MRAARWMIRLLVLGLVAAAVWFAFAPVKSVAATREVATRFGLPRSCVPLRDMLASDHGARYMVCSATLGTHLALAIVLLFSALLVLVAGGPLLRLCSSGSRAARRVLAEDDRTHREWAEQQTHGS